MRKNLLISLVGLGLALLAWSGSAQAEGEVSFGIRPTKAYVGNPESFGYFSHSLAPGAVLADEALVVNNGDVPLTLKVYAADAVTAINGGTSFANEGQEVNGVASWLSLSVTEVSLDPGEDGVVPFTITVPADASSGQHVTGLVVEAAPSGGAPLAGGGAVQFAVSVVRRAGVAVLIDVPGPRGAGLEITGVCLRQQDDQGATFEVAVRNTGNVFVRGEGSLVIKDWQGTQLASIPLKMDTVLAGDATHFQVTHPVRLANGKYLLSAVLEYDGETAVLEGVEVKVKEGQPEVGCRPEEGEPAEAGLAPPITTLTPAEEEGGPPIGRYAAYAAVLFALAVGVLISLRGLRKRPPPSR